MDDADVLDEEVWVADGTYYEHITLKDGVGLYGGFTGCNGLEETEREQRDWETNQTAIDGTDNGTVVIGANNSIVDGFIIQHWHGFECGGIENFESSPSEV